MKKWREFFKPIVQPVMQNRLRPNSQVKATQADENYDRLSIFQLVCVSLGQLKVKNCE